MNKWLAIIMCGVFVLISAGLAWYPFVVSLIIHQKTWWMNAMVIAAMIPGILGIYLSGKIQK